MADFSNSIWKKATRSGNGGNCVEVACVDNKVGVRDSKNFAKEFHIFTHAEWAVFLDKATENSGGLP